MIMDLFKILLVAIIGSLIGWLTNKIAIKMLFKPVNPVKILFFEIHGVFPKRQKELSKSLGKVVENELVSIDDLKENFLTNENIQNVKIKLKDKFDQIIKENIPPMLLAMAGEQINQILEKFANEEDDFFTELISEVMDNNETTNIKKIVENKVNKMNFAEFENILLELISKELKHIEIIGAVLGFTIGVVQGIIFLIIN